MKQPSQHLPSLHSSEWNDRLQDWVDGELGAAEAAAFEAHLKSCEECQQSVADFQQLDVALTKASPRLQLDAAFDARLFGQIDAIDDSKRAEARRRLELEWQQQLLALSRNWRRTWAFVIPGIVAGIAVVFAVMGWLDSSGVTNSLVAQGTAELGRGSTDLLRIGVTTVIGAALGMLVAPWLAKLAD